MFGRPAVYGGRLQVHFPVGNQAQVLGGAGEVRSHLPSTRRFLESNSCHLDADWASGNRWAGPRCVKTAQSGIWVPKGDARGRMIPDDLEHLRVEWRPPGSYWVTPGHDCLCSYQYGHGAAVRPQTHDAIWDGVIGLWCRVALLLSPWCARGNMPTGVNLNRYAGPGSLIRWHRTSLCSAPQNHCQVEFRGILLSSRCVAARRARFPLRLGWTMVTSSSWMV